MAESTSAQRPLDQIADGEPIISFRDVHKSFGDKHILRGITLDFPRGRTTVVIGPSGRSNDDRGPSSGEVERDASQDVLVPEGLVHVSEADDRLAVGDLIERTLCGGGLSHRGVTSGRS